MRLVTLTVDPDFDTTSVLSRYADTYQADPKRWLYLTGDKRKTYELINNSFLMPVKEYTGKDREPGYEVMHSTNILLINEKGVVVNKYNAVDPDDISRLRHDLKPYLHKGALRNADQPEPKPAAPAGRAKTRRQGVRIERSRLGACAAACECQPERAVVRDAGGRSSAHPAGPRKGPRDGDDLDLFRLVGVSRVLPGVPPGAAPLHGERIAGFSGNGCTAVRLFDDVAHAHGAGRFRAGAGDRHDVAGLERPLSNAQETGQNHVPSLALRIDDGRYHLLRAVPFADRVVGELTCET